MTDDIAAIIARLLERDLRERWDEDVLALIAAYESEAHQHSVDHEAMEELQGRAERAEQVAEGTRQMFEASQREHEVRLSEARKRIEALVAMIQAGGLRGSHKTYLQRVAVFEAARTFLASTEPRPLDESRDFDRPDPATYELGTSLYAHECHYGCDSEYAVNCNCAGDCDKHSQLGHSPEPRE